jgi:glutaconate CoA-transferase subunit B
MTKNTDYTDYTNREMQAVAIARCVKNGQIAIVGTGLPLIGASIAKRYYAPDCNLIVESGLMDCAPIEVPTSVGDCRLMAHCGAQWPNARYVGFQANEWLNDRDRMIAFIGGAQIDPYGNVNSTSIGDYFYPLARFTGSGGANGIVTFVNTIIMMQHEKRRFIEKIDYVTSPGWVDGPGGRERIGLPGNRGPQMVVTDRGVMKFDAETKRMYLAGYYASGSVKEITENTGFDIDVSRAEELPPPEPEIIRMIREDIDPGQVFIKHPAPDAKSA